MWLKEYYEVLGAATKKAQAYTDQEVSKVRTKFAVVASYADLPNPGRTDTIYLVPKAGFVSVYDQYIYENDQYTDIGDTELDLDSYATDLELSQGLATKVDKVEGYGLSKNDFTDAKDTKLANIEDGAQRNVDADSELDKTSTNAIQNKAVTEKFEEVEAEILNEDKVAEGNPITIKTGTAHAAKSTELTMSPIQDLHGYDKPWVGGAGKNVIPYPYTTPDGTLAGVEFITTSDGIIEANGQISGQVIFYLVQGLVLTDDSYTITYSGETVLNIVLTDETTSTQLWSTRSNDSYTFTADSTHTYSIRLSRSTAGANVDNNNIWVMLEKGSTAHSYEPYANICPITGRTQSEIVTQGVNLWDEVTELGIINQTTGENQNADNQIRSKNYTAIQPNTQYCFLCKGARISQIFWYDKNNVYLSYTQNTTDSAFITTSPANAYYVRFQFPMAYGTTYQNDGGVNYPSSYTDYSAHTEQTVTRSYGQTVYGGSDAIETGVLTVDTLMFDLGDLTWQTTQQTPIIFYADPRNLGEYIGTAQQTIVCCSAYQAQVNVGGAGGARTLPNGSICGFTNPDVDYHRIFVKDDAYSDVTTFTAAVTGIKACYKLATPQTITLTPAQINLIKGLNNISTDADSIKMTYTINDFVTETEMNTALESKANVIDLNAKADLTSFGPLEIITASTNYAEGDYMIFEGKFCKASSAITAGDTLEIGTNLTETTIAAELLAIISQLPTT